MLADDKFTLKATNGKDRASEISKVYRREFDIPFRNTEGAKATREGYPHPMLDGPEYLPTKWVCVTIDEDQVRDIKQAFDQELAMMTPRDRRMEEIRGCVFSRLWTKAYGANMKEKREREAHLSRMREEREEREERRRVARAHKKRKQLEEGEIEEPEEPKEDEVPKNIFGGPLHPVIFEEWDGPEPSGCLAAGWGRRSLCSYKSSPKRAKSEEGEISPAPPVQEGGPGAKRARRLIPREESSEEE